MYLQLSSYGLLYSHRRFLIMKWKRIKEVTYAPYFVSDTGLVKNGEGHIMKQTKNPVTGYSQIRLAIASGKGKSFRVHTLVATEFIPNPNNYPEVNHKNEIRTDNRVENLEWCTHKYNSNYGNHRNRVSESQRKSKKSRRIPVIIILPNGTEKYAHSLREASEITGWGRMTIQSRLENPNAIFDKDTYKFRYASNKRSNNRAIHKWGEFNLDHTKNNSYQEIVDKLKIIHPNLVMLSGVCGTHSKAHFRCLKCGNEFDKSPNEVFGQKFGCAECAKRHSAELRSKGRTEAENQIKEYLYNNLIIGDDYVKSSEPCTFICKRCGKKFTGKLTNLLHNAKIHGYVSNGCQSCSKSRSMTIKNLINYNYYREDIIKALHDKNLDWTLKDI